MDKDTTAAAHSSSAGSVPGASCCITERAPTGIQLLQQLLDKINKFQYRTALVPQGVCSDTDNGAELIVSVLCRHHSQHGESLVTSALDFLRRCCPDLTPQARGTNVIVGESRYLCSDLQVVNRALLTMRAILCNRTGHAPSSVADGALCLLVPFLADVLYRVLSPISLSAHAAEVLSLLSNRDGFGAACIAAGCIPTIVATVRCSDSLDAVLHCTNVLRSLASTPGIVSPAAAASIAQALVRAMCRHDATAGVSAHCAGAICALLRCPVNRHVVIVAAASVTQVLVSVMCRHAASGSVASECGQALWNFASASVTLPPMLTASAADVLIAALRRREFDEIAVAHCVHALCDLCPCLLQRPKIVVNSAIEAIVSAMCCHESSESVVSKCAFALSKFVSASDVPLHVTNGAIHTIVSAMRREDFADTTKLRCLHALTALRTWLLHCPNVVVHDTIDAFSSLLRRHAANESIVSQCASAIWNVLPYSFAWPLTGISSSVCALLAVMSHREFDKSTALHCMRAVYEISCSHACRAVLVDAGAARAIVSFVAGYEYCESVVSYGARTLHNLVNYSVSSDILYSLVSIMHRHQFSADVACICSNALCETSAARIRLALRSKIEMLVSLTRHHKSNEAIVLGCARLLCALSYDECNRVEIASRGAFELVVSSLLKQEADLAIAFSFAKEVHTRNNNSNAALPLYVEVLHAIQRIHDAHKAAIAHNRDGIVVVERSQAMRDTADAVRCLESIVSILAVISGSLENKRAISGAVGVIKCFVVGVESCEFHLVCSGGVGVLVSALCFYERDGDLDVHPPVMALLSDLSKTRDFSEVLIRTNMASLDLLVRMMVPLMLSRAEDCTMRDNATQILNNVKVPGAVALSLQQTAFARRRPAIDAWAAARSQFA